MKHYLINYTIHKDEILKTFAITVENKSISLYDVFSKVEELVVERHGHCNLINLCESVTRQKLQIAISRGARYHIMS